MTDTMERGASYVACVPHVPLISMQERAQNAVLWQAYDARVSEFAAFDPELVIVFGGNHYQGIHLNLSPTFVIGQVAEAIADCGGTPGKLDVPMELSVGLASALVLDGFDIATSYAMTIDHGFTNVLAAFMDGRIDRRPVIPVHINSLTFPRPTLKRCRQFGEAVGRYAAALGKRVAFLGSGGLSHQTDFIFPQYDTAKDEDIRSYIVHGGAVGPISRQKWMDDIQSGMDALSAQILDGSFKAPWINGAWDSRFLELFGSDDLSALDDWTDEEILSEAGYGGGEIRMWIAAAAAGRAAGARAPTIDFYSDQTHLAIGAGVAHSVQEAA